MLCSLPQSCSARKLAVCVQYITPEPVALCCKRGHLLLLLVPCGQGCGPCSSQRVSPVLGRRSFLPLLLKPPEHRLDMHTNTH